MHVYHQDYFAVLEPFALVFLACLALAAHGMNVVLPGTG